MKIKKIGIILFTLLVALFGGYKIYVSNYYKAQSIESTHNHESNLHIFMPEQEIEAGFIFYPGGKVEAEAYGDLMKQLSNQGILCILVEMPDNLAVLNSNGADGIQELFPEVQNWYIGGHSLGGVMASSYLSKHVEEYNGLILLAAYSTKDLSTTQLQVLSIYGSNDGVLSLDKYEEAKINYPSTFVEYVIEGGCHAYFGNYGPQKNDGTPTISYQDQIKQTTQTIYEFIKK